MDYTFCPKCHADLDTDDAPLYDLRYDRQGNAPMTCPSCGAALIIQLEERWRGEICSNYYEVALAQAVG